MDFVSELIEGYDIALGTSASHFTRGPPRSAVYLRLSRAQFR